MYVKFIILILSFLTSSLLTGQKFTEKEKEKLAMLGIEYKELIKENPDYYNEALRKILEKDRKYRTNKNVGIVLGGIGFATTVGGILIMAKKDGNGLSRTIMGGGMTGLGLIEMGVAISFSSPSKKRKRERDKMLGKLNLK